MSVIEIKQIRKDYGATRALDDITLTIQPNRIYGLLGRNGAGKTTLLNLITNRIFPTAGEITVDGESVQENDRALGQIFYMMEANLYPPAMRVRELFRWSREFYPEFDLDYAAALAGKFGLNPNKRVRELSTGYASIFKAIVTLASNAPILIMDEPVLGLDANHRDLFYKELLRNYSEQPKTVIISTHLIEEVSDVLEEVIIIRDGRVVLQRPVLDLLAQAYTVSGESEKVDQYVAGKQCAGMEVMGRFKSVTVLEDRQQVDQTLARELGLDIDKVELQKLFISLTN